MPVRTTPHTSTRRASRLLSIVAGGGLALLTCACVEPELGPDELAALGIDTAPEAWLEEGALAERPGLELAGRRDEEEDVVAVLATVRLPEEAGERKRRLLRFYRLRGRRALLLHEVRLGGPARDRRVDLSRSLEGGRDALLVGLRADPPAWASSPPPPEVADSGRRPRRPWLPELLEAATRAERATLVDASVRR